MLILKIIESFEKVESDVYNHHNHYAKFLERSTKVYFACVDTLKKHSQDPDAAAQIKLFIDT